jgi:hypothetical protein
VGVEEIVNAGAGSPTETYELNRWKALVAQDGGRGTWTPVKNAVPATFVLKVNYLPT